MQSSQSTNCWGSRQDKELPPQCISTHCFFQKESFIVKIVSTKLKSGLN